MVTFRLLRTPTVNAPVELDAFVEPGWIAQHLDEPDVRVVEVDVSPATYNQGHIPGAVLWNAYTDLRDPDYRPVPKEDFERLISRSEIGPNTTVVFYGYGAFLGFWLMKAHGHGDVRMLNGDRDEWEKQGRQWSTAVPALASASYTLPAADSELLASREVVEEAMGDPERVVLDVRSDAEFRGEWFWPSGAPEDVGRAGHIPGAVHVPIDQLRDANGDLKGIRELRALYQDAGISLDQRIITYCTIGNRASLAWFVLKYLLGYPHVGVYQGSYVEWGKLPETPVDSN
jgi:thiosulfate/3-mercaptopyruvate sulfurtransferase